MIPGGRFICLVQSFWAKPAPSWGDQEVSSSQARASLACGLPWVASSQEQVPLASWVGAITSNMGGPPIRGAGIIPGRGGQETVERGSWPLLGEERRMGFFLCCQSAPSLLLHPFLTSFTFSLRLLPLCFSQTGSHNNHNETGRWLLPPILQISKEKKMTSSHIQLTKDFLF